MVVTYYVCVLSVSAPVLLGSPYISLVEIPTPLPMLDPLLPVSCVLLFGFLPQLGEVLSSVTS